MKISFPHMGNVYVALKAVFEDLGVTVIPPPKCSKNTLELGMRHSPEQICIPFKITLGNYMESIAQGADTLFMWGGCDACRISYYHMLQEEILKELGYQIEMICGEPFKSLMEIKNFLQKLKKVAGDNHYGRIFAAFMKAVKILNDIDHLDEIFCQVRARETESGRTDRLYQEFEDGIAKINGSTETLQWISHIEGKLKNISIDPHREVLKVGIVGEIYTVVEPFINLNIIQKLGNMGVEVHRSVVASEFIREQLDFLPFIHSEKEEVHRAAEPYINLEIGGHARHTVGNAVRYYEKNYDGVIHLLPFTCMPEIVAQSVLKSIEEEKDLPILKLVLDEMTGEAGYHTRLEAFIELLWRRREKTNEEEVLSWN
ncbi:putative nucleotide-binding protein (sugar kinase/HSP70/actin superfamily) [Anaerosolibacter carboniphilus]|uniref:Putative nucleotide-binding protein (Sugar kinase/HSP70/actin superfamily) n=1 Tax=Anaerosolibacter carboniphilus TaxID=1417629 RepID=A0A841L8P7_9FIRM|nr:acyl-CoA dehydratase activase-related protein [Anaerosolibacter carboniphilus]MBB6218759.1 putative nucleotide-binding protein (sugar kinase/HSP70/actin superfamily) [Anaerosolibacter carboniphilus]